jgi:hypothetical protein
VKGRIRNLPNQTWHGSCMHLSMTNAQSTSTAEDFAETAVSHWAPLPKQLCGGQLQLRGGQLRYRPNLLAYLRGDRPFLLEFESWNDWNRDDAALAEFRTMRGSAAGTLRTLLTGLEDRGHPNSKFQVAVVRERQVLSCRPGALVLSGSRLAFAAPPQLWSRGAEQQRLLSELQSVYVRSGALHLEWKDRTQVFLMDDPEIFAGEIVHNWLYRHGFSAESPVAVLELDRAACFGHVSLPELVWRGPKGDVELSGVNGRTCVVDDGGDHLRIGPSERLLYTLRMRDKAWFLRTVAARVVAPRPVAQPLHRQIPAGNATVWTGARIVARGEVPTLYPSQDQVDLMLLPMGPISLPTIASLFVESDGERTSASVLVEAVAPEEAVGTGIYRVHFNRLKQPSGATTANVRFSVVSAPKAARLLHQSALRLVLGVEADVEPGTELYVELPDHQKRTAVVAAIGQGEREGPVLILHVTP